MKRDCPEVCVCPGVTQRGMRRGPCPEGSLMGIKDDQPRDRNIVRTGAELARLAESDRDLAEHLVNRARSEGLNLVGENGLLKGLVKLVLDDKGTVLDPPESLPCAEGREERPLGAGGAEGTRGSAELVGLLAVDDARLGVREWR